MSDDETPETPTAQIIRLAEEAYALRRELTNLRHAVRMLLASRDLDASGENAAPIRRLRALVARDVGAEITEGGRAEMERSAK